MGKMLSPFFIYTICYTFACKTSTDYLMFSPKTFGSSVILGDFFEYYSSKTRHEGKRDFHNADRSKQKPDL